MSFVLLYVAAPYNVLFRSVQFTLHLDPRTLNYKVFLETGMHSSCYAIDQVMTNTYNELHQRSTVSNQLTAYIT